MRMLDEKKSGAKDTAKERSARRIVPLAIFFAIILCIAIIALAEVAKNERKVNLVIKTGVSPFSPVLDTNTPDAYTLLKKASNDFITHYSKSNVTVSLTQYESARRGVEIDGYFGTPLSPDVIFASTFNLVTYVHEGKLIPLDSILDSGIREDIRDGCLAGCIVNGKTYMLPYITFQNALCFNKKLFRAAGLEKYCNTDAVQSWTLEEWEEVLAALKASLPSTSYPMMMYAADEQGDTHIMTLLRSRGSPFFDEYGNVCLSRAEGVEALEWLRKSNEKGYFPPHPERLVILDNYELFIAGQLGIYLVNRTIQQYFDKEGIECGYVNFPSIDGKGFTTSFDMSFAIVDNEDKNKLSAAKAFVSHIYKSRFLDYSVGGGNPVSRRVATKYAAYLSDVSRYMNNTACNINFSGSSPNWIEVRAVFYQHIRDLFTTSKSAIQIAHEIDMDLNAAINAGRETSHPHE